MNTQIYEATEVLAVETQNESPFISTEITTEESAFLSLAADWDKLAARSSATFFQTFDWQFLWWKHFGRRTHHHLLIVQVREGGRLIGLAPFFLQTHTLLGFRIFRQLKLLGSGLMSEYSPILSLEKEGPADYLDIIAETGYEDSVATKIAEFLTENNYLWDEVDLQDLPEDGFIISHLLPRLRPSEFEVTKSASDVCPKVNLPDSIDQYLASLRTNIKRSFRRAYRTYVESSDFNIEHLGPDGNTESAFQALTQLHQKRWNSIGYPGLFADKRFAAMQHDLIKALSGRDRLWIMVLRHQEKPVAARLGFAFNGRFYDYLSGIEQDNTRPGMHQYSGAGMALIFTSMDRALKSGAHVFDLLRGDEAYKFDLATDVPNNYRATIVSKMARRRKWKLFYRIHSAGYAYSMRVVCESAIFRVIAGENGTGNAVPKYLSHLFRRMTRSRSYASASVKSPKRTVTRDSNEKNSDA